MRTQKPTNLVLWGKRKDRQEDWHEEILLTNATPDKIEQIKALATKDGWECFRVASMDMEVPPDFTGTVMINKS